MTNGYGTTESYSHRNCGVSALAHFSAESYPHEDVRRLIDPLLCAFGSERLVAATRLPDDREGRYGEYRTCLPGGFGQYGQNEANRVPYSLKKFRGIFPAALTMFDRDNNVDESATAKHWDWLIRQGVDGLVIAGTSGEFIALENHERVRLFRLANEVTSGRVPLICGTGHYSTKLTIELSHEAQKNGADGILVILPYYQKPLKPAVIRHFQDVRAVVDLPIMLYNNPANSACVDLNPREVAQLVEEDVLHMVKSTYETVVPIHDLNYLVGDRMAIFYGSFQAAFEAMAAGGSVAFSMWLRAPPARCMMRRCSRTMRAEGSKSGSEFFCWFTSTRINRSAQ